jgi:hypothetical protein
LYPRLRWFDSGTGLLWNLRFLIDHGIPHDSADPAVSKATRDSRLRSYTAPQNVQNGLATSSGNGRLEVFWELLVPTYLVRFIKSHDIVGFFTADDLDELELAIDECTDPVACEYIELPVGGIMWASSARPVPVDVGDDEEVELLPELPWREAELSESWWNVIYGYTDGTWTPFDLEAPQDPMADPPPSDPNG